jgi:eukaryotic-like serine/threonine-protein kinase
MRLVRLLIFILIPIVSLLLSAYLTIGILLKSEDTVMCPDVRGRHVDEAKQIAERHGVSLSVVRYERRNDVPLNHVTVQKPEANIAMRKGRSLNVLVSEGPELVKMPFVVGQNLADAKEIVAAQHLVVDRVIAVPHDEADKVIIQIPEANQDVVHGHKAVLFVGTPAKRYFVMPDLRQASWAEVTQDLEYRKIRYRIVRSTSLPYGSPAVLASSPPAGSVFSSDDEVTLYLGNGG